MKMTPDKAHSQAEAETALEAIFAQARSNPVVAEPDFMSRIMADAIALQPKPAPVAKARRGVFARLAAALGGALMLLGVSSAAMAGLVIGYVQPEPMLDLAEEFGLAAIESVELMPSYTVMLDGE